VSPVSTALASVSRSPAHTFRAKRGLRRGRCRRSLRQCRPPGPTARAPRARLQRSIEALRRRPRRRRGSSDRSRHLTPDQKPAGRRLTLVRNGSDSTVREESATLHAWTVPAPCHARLGSRFATPLGSSLSRFPPGSRAGPSEPTCLPFRQTPTAPSNCVSTRAGRPIEMHLNSRNCQRNRWSWSSRWAKAAGGAASRPEQQRVSCSPRC
jgi:hypothetical protein